MIILKCEVCSKDYKVLYDPKVITERNPIPFNHHYCSVECEVEGNLQEVRKKEEGKGIKDNKIGPG